MGEQPLSWVGLGSVLWKLQSIAVVEVPVEDPTAAAVVVVDNKVAAVSDSMVVVEVGPDCSPVVAVGSRIVVTW